ncbi:High affinity copper uptake protein 1 [Holothuria leucospilota]|uniref:Copper transport protein n=1 Tax=Holothuria leucospilota TaxID=206669 RepID=A0A9Q1C6I4_HOLLE|nr:High affinity copper uptake protein 1 [Holothuria leucospilota]
MMMMVTPMMMMMPMMMMDDMFFRFEVETTILFEFWKVETVSGLFFSCVVVFLLALLFEGLKVFRLRLGAIQTPDAKETKEKSESTEKSPILEEEENDNSLPFLSWGHLFQTCCHVVQVSVAYALMLIVMTYNAWLAISVLLGAGFGFYFFGWMSKVSSLTTNKKE